MANRINLFEVLREEEEEEAEEDDAHMGAERNQSTQEQSMSSVHGNSTHWRHRSSSAILQSSVTSPSRPVLDKNYQTHVASRPVDDSRIYIRGVKPEAKICKAHFTAWRRNLHRGCEDESCTLHHDPREWPDWCIDLVPSGPLKELLEIQRDIDAVLGKDALQVDDTLAMIKPSAISPGRARNQEHDTRGTSRRAEELSPQQLAAKERLIQHIWDESIRQYRLRKEKPEEMQATSGYYNLEHYPAQNRPRTLSFFGDDEPVDHDSN